MANSETETKVWTVLTADNCVVRKQFCDLLKTELEEIVPLLAQALDDAADFCDIADGDQNCEMVGWLIFSALQGCLISLRLFLDGFVLQSGNAQRQALENIGLAIVCSKPELGFLERFHQDQYSPSRAIQDAIRNAEKLGVSKSALETIKTSVKFYDQFSHASKMTIALYSNLSGADCGSLGGMYDLSKKEQYLKEGRGRLGLAKILRSFVAGVRQNMKGAT